MDIEKIKSKKSINELLEFGIVNIDKPSRKTSFDVSNFVKKILSLRKTSHFGTLDPKVTGVLPVALNRACKLTGFFLKQDKEYVGVMRFHKDISSDKIKNAIEKKFLGKIIQKPPVRSRVKRQKRQREVKRFLILKKENKDVSFEVEVESGTYIRKLVHDLGQEVGVGAHMLKLRRVRAGIFCKKDSINLKDFEKAVKEYRTGCVNSEEKLRKIIIPAEIISEIFPVVEIKKESSKKILHGKPIFYADLKKREDIKNEINQIISVFSNDKFIGMFKVVKGEKIFAKPEFVLQPINKS